MRALTLAGVVAGLLALPSAASAQHWGHEKFPQSGACFFRDVDYRGDYFCVGAGADVGAVPDDMNDRISSIKVFGRAQVAVFRDVRFGGGSTRFNSNIPNLKDQGWNDRISSLRVQGEGDKRFGDLQDDQRGRDRKGEDPDRIIKRAYQDVLGRDPDAGGLRQYRGRIIDDHWTEDQVRESLRNSPEFREKITMTRDKAEGIVRAAYLAVLKREPDPAGSEGYIQSVLRDKWSQQDVERELRKSDEFRNRR
jgi:Domain of unknown function (DUF4214)/Peptidase inhibitor family I36